jgi:hypothetical protein
VSARKHRVRRQGIAQRFAALLAQHGDSNACWLWTGTIDKDGYGRGGAKQAHRLSYEFFVGQIPDGLQIDHTCHDPTVCRGGSWCSHRSCVNPAHLEPVTHGENTRRGATAKLSDEAKAETEIWEKRVLQLERQVKRLTEDKDAKLRNDKHYPIALDLIDEWKRECGHPNASASDPRRVQLALSVVKRYKDQREKLSLVIQQAKHLAFVDPNTGFRYDEFGRLFGSSDEIEKRATQYWLWNQRRSNAALSSQAQ